MLTDEMLRSGQVTPPPEPVLLAVGPLTCRFAAGELRDVRWGGVEVVRRLYVAVRDRDWGTVPIAVEDVQVTQDAGAFTVSFTATHRTGTPEPIDFRWHGRFVGAATGTLRATMDGAAATTFLRNRIGWCVLHPPETCAGEPCTITHPDGTTIDAAFPSLIAPHQPFLDIRAMTHATRDGPRVTLTFAGDVFETEDQRNWTDDSYKTYGTPLTLPFPVRIAAGERIRQDVTIEITGEATRIVFPTPSEIVMLTVGGTPVGPLPALGLGIAADAPPTTTERARLAALGLRHLRIDLHLADGADDTGWHAAWHAAATEANALDVPLLVALFLPEDAEESLLAWLAAYHARPAPIDAVLVFDAQGITTPAPLVAAVREALDAALPLVPIGGGTDAFFTELNRNRPPVDALDFVSWSLNPTVHADDNNSIVETLAGQTATATSARALTGDLPLTVSPVTLRSRRNPNATRPAVPLPAGTPPPRVDPRQLSLFGAGWTAMTVKRLAEAGVARVTLYETLGLCGVMARDTPLPYATNFPAEPGGVYPLYHVLADLGAVADGAVLPVTSSGPRHVDALAVRSADRVLLIVANLHDADARVAVRFPMLVAQARVRLLDCASARTAMHDPASWRASPAAHGPLPLTTDGMTGTLTLPPYAVATVEVASSE